MMHTDRTPYTPAKHTLRHLVCAMGLGLGLAGPAVWANDAPPSKKQVLGEINASSASNPKDVGNQVREALGTSVAPNKKLTVTVSSHGASNPSGAPVNPRHSREYMQTRAARGGAVAVAAASPASGGHGGEPHWGYEGEAGPASWGNLKPEFNLCALGKRQSPINIQNGTTLAGPVEAIQFNYTPSNGVVVNNGHTIQVNVEGNNSITVRGARYQLLQFHFHTPSEEQINFKRSAMVAHLVHKNDAGQLAVVGVLMEPGEANAFINKIWTYMPLDSGDRVSMPADSLNVNEFLPTDQRYYQFMGSLTTPPCSEGVLWMVLKTPVQIAKAQHKLFTQIFPMNARPVQAVNGRVVREAQ
jgi:carbonic anhydrase